MLGWSMAIAAIAPAGLSGERGPAKILGLALRAADEIRRRQQQNGNRPRDPRNQSDFQKSFLAILSRSARMIRSPADRFERDSLIFQCVIPYD